MPVRLKSTSLYILIFGWHWTCGSVLSAVLYIAVLCGATATGFFTQGVALIFATLEKWTCRSHSGRAV
jgi:hypothetical protein